MTSSDSECSHPSDAMLDLRAVAERLGVHYMTAYRYVRLGRLPAERRGGRWWVRATDAEQFAAGTVGRSPNSAHPTRPDLPSYRRRLRPVLLAGDESAAWQLCEQALVSAVEPKDFLLDVLAPLLHDIGADCAKARVTVGEEHLATIVAVRLVCRLAPLFTRRGRARSTVVVAGVVGNVHVLPVMLVATILRGEGFAVIELGGDTPPEAVIAAASSAHGLAAVALSVGTDHTYPAARHATQEIRSALPQVPVFIGGPAVRSEPIATDLGADGWADRADDFAGG